MALRERIRSKKRELGIGEGIMERMTPTPSEMTRIPRMESIIDLGIVRGTARGPKKGQWYSVSFPKELEDPVVVAVATEKSGNIIDRNISRVSSPPSERISGISPISFAEVGFTPVEFTPVAFTGVRFDEVNISRYIPRIKRDDFNSDEYCKEVASTARDKAKKLGPPWPLNMIWDWFCDTFVYTTWFWAWKAGGWVLNTMWDYFVQPQIDEVEDELGHTVDDINSQVNKLRKNINDKVNQVIDTMDVQIDKAIRNMNSSVNSSLSEVNSNINNSLDEVSSKINSRIDDITGATNSAMDKNFDKLQSQVNQVQDRVNDRLRDLYDMWGIPSDKSLAPVHIRNVTNRGFEWLSLGDMEIYWIAIGDTEFERPIR